MRHTLHGTPPGHLDASLHGGALPAPPFPGDHVLDEFRAVRAAAGEELLRRGAADRRLLWLEQGEAELVVGQGRDELVVGVVGPGTLCGLRGHLGLAPRRLATLRARGACRLLRLDWRHELRLDPVHRRLSRHLEQALIRLTLRQLTVPVAGLAEGPAAPLPIYGVPRRLDRAHVPDLYRVARGLRRLVLPRGSALHAAGGGTLPVGGWFLLRGRLLVGASAAHEGAGGLDTTRTARAGAIGGYEAVLGHPSLRGGVVALSDAFVAPFDDAALRWACDALDHDGSALRRALVVDLSRRLHLGRLERLRGLQAGSRAASLVEVDQALMLAWAAAGCAETL